MNIFFSIKQINFKSQPNELGMSFAYVRYVFCNERVVTEYFSKKEYWSQILNMCNLLRDLGDL